MRDPNDEQSTRPTQAATPANRCHQALVGVIRDELGQLDALIGDAAVRLTRSFEAMALAAARPDGSAHAAPRCRAGERDTDVADSGMERALDDAATALQFHDIASQLLASIGTHVEQLDSTSAIWFTPAYRPDDTTPDHRAALPLRTSVTQTTMTVGTVELF